MKKERQELKSEVMQGLINELEKAQKAATPIDTPANGEIRTGATQENASKQPAIQFRNNRWGATPSEIGALRNRKNSEVIGGSVSIAKYDEDLRIGSVPLYSIRYHFYKNKLYEVYISINSSPNDGNANAEGLLLKMFKEKYPDKNPEKSDTAGRIEWIWKWPDTEVTLSSNSLIYRYLPIMKEAYNHKPSSEL